MCVEWTGSCCHWQVFPSALFARAFREETAKSLERGTVGSILFFKCHDRDVIVWAAFSTDATADAAFGDVDLPAWHACDSSAATEHAHRILTLAAGCSNADVANDHAFAVHA